MRAGPSWVASKSINRLCRLPTPSFPERFLAEGSWRKTESKAERGRGKVGLNMDQIDNLKGCTDLDLSKDGTKNSGGASRWSGALYEEKKAAVEAEVARVNLLPFNSSYAVHRLRVLNKLLHLMSIQRTVPQEEELELLFASLSL